MQQRRVRVLRERLDVWGVGAALPRVGSTRAIVAVVLIVAPALVVGPAVGHSRDEGGEEPVRARPGRFGQAYNNVMTLGLAGGLTA